MAAITLEQPPASPMEASTTMVAMPAKLLLASDHGECERLKDLMKKEDATTMVVVMSSNEKEVETKPARTIMDPRLQMAARNGDHKMLETMLLNHQLHGRTNVTKQHHLIIHLSVGSAGTDGKDGADPDHKATADGKDADQSASSSNNGILAAQQSCAVTGESAILLDGVTLDSEEDSALHLVAASGDTEQYLECAELVYSKAAHLLHEPNKSGDTPLHCAARAGNLNMVSRLIEMAARGNGGKKRVLELLSTKNRLGETVLHGAVRSANIKIIERLLSEDLELVYVPSDGISPLYLAISLGRLDIARELMQRTSKRLSYFGPGGRNVLHIALFQREALPVLLQTCKDVEIIIEQGNQKLRVPLLKHLTNQRDKLGSTPLHLAASLETTCTGFLGWCEHFWPKESATAMLVEANESAVYQSDNKGLYPIHVAVCNGTLKVVLMLLTRYPDCANLRDTNGRTFLHVAIEKNRYDIVKFVCGRPEFLSILNVQDKHGDTALHLAVRFGALSIFNCLFRNMHVCLDLSNKDGLTPRDLSWIVIPGKFYHNNKENPQFLIHQALALAGAAVGCCRTDHFYDKYTKPRDDEIDSEYMTNSAQVVGITSVLVATASFAAAFTLPGGYRAEDHTNGGTPTLAPLYTFGVFVVSNTLAFTCSLLSTACLLYSGLNSTEISIRRWYHALSRLLLLSSVRSFVAAFAMGMYVVLAPVALKLAISVCIISFASLLCENTGVSLFLMQANTLRIRLGIMPATSQVWPTLEVIFKRFWSYIIIFGLPAILKIHGTR